MVWNKRKRMEILLIILALSAIIYITGPKTETLDPPSTEPPNTKPTVPLRPAPPVVLTTPTPTKVWKQPSV